MHDKIILFDAMLLVQKKHNAGKLHSTKYWITMALDWTGRNIPPMGKSILGKQMIVCAKQVLCKRHVNEMIVYAKFYSLRLRCAMKIWIKSTVIDVNS